MNDHPQTPSYIERGHSNSPRWERAHYIKREGEPASLEAETKP